MKETFFKNQTFKVCLVVTLTLLLVWNLYTFIMLDASSALIRCLIQFTILMLIFTKSEHAKTGISIFSVLLIISSSFLLAAKLIKLFVGKSTVEVTVELIMSMILLIVGILIYHYNSTTVIVKTVIKNPDQSIN